MAPLLLCPPVSAPRDPVSPAEDDEEHDRDEAGEVEPMIGPRRTMLGDRGGRGSSVGDLDNDENDCDDLHGSSPPSTPWSLQDRLVQLLSTWSPASLRRVAPVQVSTELGVSVEDATAELCRLLAAVGNDSTEEGGSGGGATFSFVRLPLQHQSPCDLQEGKAAAPTRPISDHVTMVFSFPKDFQRRARRNRRRSEVSSMMRELGVVLFRAVKVVTALGLFVSLLIVAVVAVAAALVAVVALGRQGFSPSDAAGGRHLRQHLRTMCDACRNCLWCYAVFMPAGGGVGGANHDPFLRELAADLSLLCGCLRGSPLSLWYWLTFRRHRWRRPRQPQQEPYHGMVRVGMWGTPGEEEEHDSDHPNRLTGASGERSGLLGGAAEFLFGPTPFSPGPAPAEKWRLRARVILDKCGAAQASGAVSLAELGPFVDDPPASIRDDSPKVVAQGLVLVSHFRGVPSLSATASESMDVRGSPQSTFVFPELMAESAHLSGSVPSAYGSENIDTPWTKNLFYEAEPATVPSRSARATSATSSAAKVPSFLVEMPYRLTRLTQRQFVLCAVLVTVNGLGVLWLRQSICHGGSLPGASRTALGYLLCRVAVPVLHFYSILFVALPLGRLALIVLWNAQIQRRNRRRRNLARELESS